MVVVLVMLWVRSIIVFHANTVSLFLQVWGIISWIHMCFVIYHDMNFVACVYVCLPDML